MRPAELAPAALRPALLATLCLLLATLAPATSATDLPSERAVGELEAVHLFDDWMPTGVTVSAEGRVFVNFPRWGDGPPFTVAEIAGGALRPYPSVEIQVPSPTEPSEERLVSVQSVVVDPRDRLWLLDTGRPRFQPAEPGAAKLVGVDLATDEVFRVIVFPPDVARPTTYLNDIRFDLTRGEAGMAFITDSSLSGDNGLIVVDLATGESWRRLDRHPSTLPDEHFVPMVEGRPLLNRPPEGNARPMTVGADGIALSADGERLYYRPLSGHGLFSVSVDALADRDLNAAAVAGTVLALGPLSFASDGLESDAAGRLYLTDYENNAVHRWSPDGELETLVHDPRALWPDTLALAPGGWLYFTANQLHRQAGFHRGTDLRERPYVLFRVRVDAKPVRRATE